VRDAQATLREPGLDDIEAVLQDYRNAAENAGDAGFDGVELQAAHGALPERFFTPAAGRADGYGGSGEGRSRLLREALQALVGVWGGPRVGVCLSPRPQDEPAFQARLLGELVRQKVAYVQLSEPGAARLSRRLRPYFPGPLIAAGGFDGPGAEQEIAAGHADAIAFGSAFLADPALVARLRQGPRAGAPC
jgi:N-ethylmaleimide reductase